MLRKDNILKSLLFSFCLPSAILSITMALQIAVSFLSNKRHCFSPLSSLISLQETIKYLFLSRNTESSYQQKGKKKEISQQWRFFLYCVLFFFQQVSKRRKKSHFLRCYPLLLKGELEIKIKLLFSENAVTLKRIPPSHTCSFFSLSFFFSCVSFSFCLFFFVFFFFLIK